MDGLPSVFDYRDYRAYLREYYSERKRIEYGFSYRKFAAEVGFRSPNYLKLVSEAARDLTAEMALRFGRACALRGEQLEYFCDLVGFNQATTAEERKRWYVRLQRYPEYRKVFALDAAQAAYHSEWFIPVVRELVAIPGFQEDPKWIASQLVPQISIAQARQALSVLGELGLVQRQSGGLLQSTPLVSTGEGPLGHHIVEYHRTLLKLAADAIDRIPRADREFGALMLPLTGEQQTELKQDLYALRQKWLQRSNANGASRVVQVNLQMFPVTKPTR